MSRTGRVLHTGALTAFARGSLYMAAILRVSADHELILAVPTGALAQAWARAAGGRYRLELLMQAALAVPLPEPVARSVGELIEGAGSDDAVAGHCVQLAVSQGWAVLTDDAAPLRALNGDVEVDEVP